MDITKLNESKKSWIWEKIGAYVGMKAGKGRGNYVVMMSKSKRDIFFKPQREDIQSLWQCEDYCLLKDQDHY